MASLMMRSPSRGSTDTVDVQLMASLSSTVTVGVAAVLVGVANTLERPAARVVIAGVVTSGDALVNRHACPIRSNLASIGKLPWLPATRAPPPAVTSPLAATPRTPSDSCRVQSTVPPVSRRRTIAAASSPEGMAELHTK